jgi:hypothetical protein
MDEDYARLLRDWLQADPGTPTPRPAPDEGACHEPTIPVPRTTPENRTRRGDRVRSEAEERSRRDHPSNWRRRQLPAEIRDRLAMPEEGSRRSRSEAEEGSRRSRSGAGEWCGPAPVESRSEAGEWCGPAPVGSRSEAEERSRRNHPSNWKRPGDQ